MEKMSRNWEMDKQNMAQPFNTVLLLRNKMKWSTDTCHGVDEPQRMTMRSIYSRLVQHKRGLSSGASGKESAYNAWDVRDVSSASG